MTRDFFVSEISIIGQAESRRLRSSSAGAPRLLDKDLRQMA